MKLDTKLKYGSIGLVILLIGAGIAFMSMDGGSDSSNSARPTLENKAEKSRPKKANHRSTRKGKIQGARRGSEKDIKLETRVKPSMFLDNEEEKELTELARKVLASLQTALDNEDFSQIRQVLEMAQNAPKGSLGRNTDGMPVALKKKLIEAISWFGAQGLPELIGFIADANEEVAQMALDQFEQALSDISLGDRERAKIVSLASTVITDSDALEQIFMEISNMRNSVAANTIFTICQDGTPEAKKLLNEEIRLFYVGVTRAKSRLTFVCDNSHGAPEISRFIRSYMSEKPKSGREKDSKKALAKIKSFRRKNKENRQTRRKSSRKKRNKTIHHGLQPGMRVEHNQFGGGVVLGVEDEKGVIRFDDGTSRLLNLNYSMETGILRLIKKIP